MAPAVVDRVRALLGAHSARMSVFIHVFSKGAIPDEGDGVVAVPEVPKAECEQYTGDDLSALSMSVTHKIRKYFRGASTVPPTVTGGVPLVTEFFEQLALRDRCRAAGGTTVPVPVWIMFIDIVGELGCTTDGDE